MSATADLTHTRAGFQKRDLAIGQATVMDKVFAQSATRPAAAEHRLVAIEPFFTDFADPGLNSQQHRLPSPGGFSNTHATEYSEGARREARGVGIMNILTSHLSRLTIHASWFDTPQDRLLPSARISAYPLQAELL